MKNYKFKPFIKNKKRRYASSQSSGYTSSGSYSQNSQNTVSTLGSINRQLPLSRILKISDKRVCSIPCRSVVNMGFQSVTGGGALLGGATTADLCIGVTQGYFVGVQNNSPWFQLGGTFYNAASCAAVFQEYRITKFQVDVYYSANSNALQNSAVGNAALPMVYVVQDREEARSLTTAAQCLQYASCRAMQMGNSSGNENGRQSIVMNSPSCFGAVDNDSTLLGTIQASTVIKSPWLACGTNTQAGVPAIIPHGYIKLFIDPVNVVTGQYLGNFSFVMSAIVEYRGID